MSAEIVVRLLEGGVVTQAEIEVALLAAVIRGEPFLTTLVGQRADLAGVVDRELSRADAPVLRTVQADRDLASTLPVGLCERLLAVPVRRESITGTVDVAAADPFDSHVAQEFAFHLDAPIRILRAPPAEVTAAIDGLHAGGVFAGRVRRSLSAEAAPSRSSWPQSRAPGASVPPSAITSAPPIPLVQRSQAAAPPDPGSFGPHRPTDPGVGSSRRAYPELGHDESGEPVIGLVRSKLPGALRESAPNVALAELLASAERAIAAATSPERVVDLVVHYACPEGATLVFNVKSHEYVARAASLEVAGLREVTVVASRPSVFSIAAEHGYYLGPLPDTLPHALLRDLLGARLGPEVYVVPVLAGGRSVLMVLITGFERSFTATKRVDRIAELASAALVRIMERRKRGQSPADGS